MLHKPLPLLPLIHSECRQSSEGVILLLLCLCSGFPTRAVAALCPFSLQAGFRWLAAAQRKENPAFSRTLPHQPRTAKRPRIQTPSSGGKMSGSGTGSEGQMRECGKFGSSHHSSFLQLGATVVCGKGDGGNKEEQSDDRRIHKVLEKDTGRLA